MAACATFVDRSRSPWSQGKGKTHAALQGDDSERAVPGLTRRDAPPE
jgi:hypothetical protein